MQMPMSDSSKAPPSNTIVHRGPQHSAPYPVSRLAPAFDAAVAAQDLAKDLARAEHMLGAVARGKIELIVEQIQSLQAQAQRIVSQAQEDLELHRAECRFAREAGGVYHLYHRPDNTRYFSLLSPQDWGGEPPHHYEGSYQLLDDMRYMRVEL